MNIKKQVVSLEIAQRLAALGVEQKSYFAWCGGLLFRSREVGEGYGEISAAAYTVAELIELLGENFGSLYRLKDGSFYVHAKGRNFQAATMPDALGLLLERVLSEVK